MFILYFCRIWLQDFQGRISMMLLQKVFTCMDCSWKEQVWIENLENWLRVKLR